MARTATPFMDGHDDGRGGRGLPAHHISDMVKEKSKTSFKPVQDHSEIRRDKNVAAQKAAKKAKSIKKEEKSPKYTFQTHKSLEDPSKTSDPNYFMPKKPFE